MSRRPLDLEVRCDCGAVWRGKFAVANKTIDAHRVPTRRECHVHLPSPRTDADYRQRYPLAEEAR